MKRTVYRRFLSGFAIFFLVATAAVGAPPCGPAFDIVAYFENFAERVPEKLSELPDLKHLVAELAKDPGLSVAFRLRLAKALEDPSLTVVRLTALLAEQSGSTPNAGWLDVREGVLKFNVAEDVKLPQTINQQGFSNVPLLSDKVIAVGAGTLGKPEPPAAQLETLVHELAHLRLNQFLDKRGAWLAQRYSQPETIAAIQELAKQKHPLQKVAAARITDAEWKQPLIYLDAKGKAVLSQHFYDFLQERYAREVTAELQQQPAFRDRFPGRPAIRRSRVGIDTVNTYQITDPRVQSLASVPLYDLLRGAVPKIEPMDETAFVWPPPNIRIHNPGEEQTLSLPLEIARSLGRKPN